MDADDVRQCHRCGDLKVIAEFDVRADTGRLRGICKACRRAYQRLRWTRSTNSALSSRVIGALELYPCRRCGEAKPAAEFPRRASGSRYLHSWCCDCFSAYKAERHMRNHAREMARIRRNQKAYVARNLRLVREYLASHPCLDCGEMDPIVLEFDHLRDKTSDVSQLVHNGHPWQRIVEEIAKCEVRCANDHRRVTHTRRLASKDLAEGPGRWCLRPRTGTIRRPALSKSAALSN